MRRQIWILFLIFVSLRLVFAFHLPIFNDEAIYMRWGMGFLQNPSHWWAWTLDGKQPAVAVSFGLAQLLPLDPLVAMRLVSIAWSAVTFWTVYFLLQYVSGSLKIKSNNLVVYGLLFLAVCPYLIFYDALALAESPVTACFALALLLTLFSCAGPRFSFLWL